MFDDYHLLDIEVEVILEWDSGHMHTKFMMVVQPYVLVVQIIQAEI